MYESDSDEFNFDQDAESVAKSVDESVDDDDDGNGYCSFSGLEALVLDYNQEEEEEDDTLTGSNFDDKEDKTTGGPVRRTLPRRKMNQSNRVTMQSHPVRRTLPSPKPNLNTLIKRRPENCAQLGSAEPA